MNKDNILHEMEKGLYERVIKWRERAIQRVNAIKRNKKKQADLARQYYEIDQQSMVKEWPEMLELIAQLTPAQRKTKRDRLIDPKRYPQKKKKRAYPILQEKHLPTFEQYKKQFGPHLPEKEKQGKGRRFTGPMKKVISYEEFLKQNRNRAKPKYESYQARKEAGETMTQILERKNKK